MIRLHTPITEKDIETLKVGEKVLMKSGELNLG